MFKRNSHIVVQSFFGHLADGCANFLFVSSAQMTKDSDDGVDLRNAGQIDGAFLQDLRFLRNSVSNEVFQSDRQNSEKNNDN